MPIAAVTIDGAQDEVIERISALGLVVERLKRIPLVLVEGTENQMDDLRLAIGDARVALIGIGAPLLGGIDVMVEVGLYNRAAALDEIDPYPVFQSGRVEAVGPGLQTPRPQLVALNISLTPPSPIAPFDPTDPVTLSTAVAARVVPVIMAAGNDALLLEGRESMSSWAEAPWVIAVGATTAQSGESVAEYSSQGTPDGRIKGPDIVAWGRSELSPYPDGTSFAAPRVSRQLAGLGAYLVTLCECARRNGGQEPRGIPLMAIGVIDDGVRKGWRRNGRKPIYALPVSGFRDDQLSSIAELADLLLPSPDTLWRMLQRSARPVRDADPHEAGVGFVSDETTEAYLTRFDESELRQVLGLPAGSDKTTPLAHQGSLRELLRTWFESMFVFGYDVRTGSFEGVE